MGEKISSELILNQWLKYHNTTIKEVEVKHPKELKKGTWFNYYPVTKEQYDEWNEWLVGYIKTITKLSIPRIKKDLPWVRLDFAPNIIGENEKV